MSKALILQHVAHEGPGRIVPIFRDFGIPIEICRLYAGDPVPEDLDEVRVLVVLGGPMSVSDIGSPKYPFLARESEVLKRMVAADRPVLGICLGAQLLAHAAGAKVYPNTQPGPTPGAPPVPAPELGWGPISLPFPGGTDPILMGVHDGAEMFHWHFETFDLPKLPPPANLPPGVPPPTGCALLASTPTCRNQAFRLKSHLVGFQFHVELDPDGVDAILHHDAELLARTLGPDARGDIHAHMLHCYAKYERLGNRILRNFVQFMKLY